MSCRENPASSALVTLSSGAGHDGGLLEAQVQSILHELKRTAPDDAVRPGPEEYHGFLRSVRRTLTTEQARRVVPRLEAALDGPTPDAATFHAMTQVRATCDAAKRSLKSSMRRIALRRLGNPEYDNERIRRAFLATEAAVVQTRYERFRALAEQDRNLRAPQGFLERFRATGSHTAAVPGDRATVYALWRAGSSGAQFAPAPPAGSQWHETTASWTELRRGDVIVEPGYRAPGDVDHEGKQVASVDRVPNPRLPSAPLTKVTFTDGSSEIRGGSQFRVLRAHTADQEQQLQRYREVQRRSDDTGRDRHGWYVVDPDSGEKVYHP